MQIGYWRVGLDVNAAGVERVLADVAHLHHLHERGLERRDVLQTDVETFR